MPLKDQGNRDLLITALDKNIFVEAGAGSGKTTAMVSRIVEVISQGESTIEKIVAITFTNEGAASLRSKIQKNLEEKNKDSKTSKKVKNNLIDAISNLSLARIGTIHSFCGDLLRERPIESGLDPDYEISTEGDPNSTLQAIWNKFILLHSQDENDPIGSFLISETIDLDRLYEMVAAGIKYPEIDIISSNTDKPSKEQTTGAFEQLIPLIQDMNGLKNRIAYDGTVKTEINRGKYVDDLVEQSRLYRHQQLDTLDFFVNHKPLTSTPAWKCDPKKKDKDQTPLKELDDKICQICNEIKTRYNLYVHHIIVGIIEEFKKFYFGEKKKMSSLGFDDLLFFTRELLRQNEETREYFKAKFERLFVDEVQDNDPLQTEILFFLAEESGSFASEWDKVKLKPGKLFMVGDPKQSIYRFRRADIEVYEKSKQIINEQDGLLLDLTTNFRSVPAVIDFVNLHFSKSFEKLRDTIKQGFHPNYTSLEVNPEKVYSDKPTIYVNLTSATDGIDSEALKTAAFIREQVEKNGYAYSDIMILFRKYANMQSYALAFESAEIPSIEIGEKQYFTIVEVRALVSALQALDDPTDTISLYSTLRSPIFGFSDRELFDFSKDAGGITLFHGSENEEYTPGRALYELNKLFQRKKELRPSGVVKAILDFSGVLNVLLASNYGQQRAAKIIRLIEMLHEYEEDTSLTFSGIVRALIELTESENTRLGAIHISPAAADSVKMMTIHKAKGLESKVVVLADAFSINNYKSAKQYLTRVDDKIEMIIPYNKTGFGNLDSNDVIAEDKLKSESEEERLRYVAATRASDVLMICIAAETNYAHNEPFRASIIGDNSQPAAGIELFDTGIEPNDRTGDEETLDLDVAYAEQKGKQKTNLASIKENSEKINSFFRNVHAEMDIPKDVYSHPGRVPLGKEFGSLVHKLMEYHVTIPGFDPDTVIDRLIDDFEVKPSHKTTALAYYKAFTEHPLVINAINSPEKFCEWEFFTKQDDGTLLTGVIDLVYKNPDGTWTIVDYKTDDVSDPGYRSRIDPLYQQQIELYKKSFEAVTGNYVSNAKVIYNE